MQASILKTLAYADIFDYPLTLEEIHHWCTKPISLSHLSRFIPSIIHNRKGYYFLPARSRIVNFRLRRFRLSRPKHRLAQKIGRWLKLIPTIKLVAITGGLAMNNATQNDDIDLLIVTSPHTLWLTRLLVVPLISLIAHRRKPETKDHRNAICLNLWLDTLALTLPRPHRNLYTAHEVTQTKPLWDRHDTYRQFLFTNYWIKTYLPNIQIPKVPKFSLFTFHFSLFTFLNRLAFYLQLWYMKSKMTTERVTLHTAFFHPHDTPRTVLSQYRTRLHKLGLND